MPAPDTDFWLLISGTPAGPFPLTAVLAKLAAGEVGWDTRACPVGGGAWLPLLQTPGVGPADQRSVDPDSRPAPAGPPPAAGAVPLPSPAPAAGPTWPQAVAGVVGLTVLGLIGYGVYEMARPPTPREVFDRFDKAKTAAEAKRYATRAFQPVVDAFWDLPDDGTDRFEVTHDGPAPPGMGGHCVGFRGDTFMPEAGRRVRIEGVVQFLDQDGWKVADILYLSVDGQRLATPVSLADGLRATRPGGGPPPGGANPDYSPESTRKASAVV